MEAGAWLVVDDEHEERAVYVVEGAIACDGQVLQPGTMAVFHPHAQVELAAEGASRIMLLGGAKLDGERFIDWNFVSSSKERIERAKKTYGLHAQATSLCLRSRNTFQTRANP